MSGYNDGEALILTTLRKHANYNSENTSRANWRILNSGKAAYYVVMRPGEFAVNLTSVGGIGSGSVATEVTNWTTELMVYQRYVDDGTTAINIQLRVAEIVAQMQKWRRLADTNDIIQKARVVGGSELEEIQQGENGPVFLRWIINVTWDEERAVTFSE